mgnify:FL=1|tara:strand:- start:244 stop:624 length:381 start_codon:yes stop_codon:yes gene_type:complete
MSEEELDYEENEDDLIDINIHFEPCPSSDFDDLTKDMDVMSEKIIAAWVVPIEKNIIERIYPDYEVLTVYCNELSKEECWIQFTTRYDWMRKTNEPDSDFEKEMVDFLEKKYPESKVDVSHTRWGG